MRRLFVLTPALWAFAACAPNTAHPTPPGEPPMKTPADQPTEKAAAKAADQPFGDAPSRVDRAVAVPGYTVHVVEAEHRPYGALAPQVGKPLRGADAFHAARQAIGDPDPAALARLAMLFLDVDVAGRDPWTAAAAFGEAEQRAMAHDPRREGEAVVYWRLHATTADLVRCTLAVEAGTVRCEDAPSLARAAAVEADPLAAAKADLASDNWSIRSRGLRLLAESAAPAATALLVETIGAGEPAKMRQLAIEAAAKRSDDAALPAIAAAVKGDADAGVRRAGVIALRGHTSAAAVDALKHAAANDADPAVKAMAGALLPK
ncbi:MAG: HEAT repeat domain-containing protein [bacterium]